MNNSKDAPAFPRTRDAIAYENRDFDLSGMTFRQYAAVAALQGILTHPEGPAGDWLRCSIDALAAADALIKQLEVNDAQS